MKVGGISRPELFCRVFRPWAGKVDKSPLARWLRMAPVVLVRGGGIFAATQLDTSAGTDPLVNKGSSESKATQGFHQDFGDEPVIVLAKEDLCMLVIPKAPKPPFDPAECSAGR